MDFFKENKNHNVLFYLVKKFSKIITIRHLPCLRLVSTEKYATINDFKNGGEIAKRVLMGEGVAKSISSSKIENNQTAFN